MDYIEFAVRLSVSSQQEIDKLTDRGIALGTKLYGDQVIKWIKELNQLKSLESYVNISPLNPSIRKLYEKHLLLSYLIGYNSVKEEIKQQQDFGIKEEAVVAYTIAIRKLKNLISLPAKEYARITGIINEISFTIAGIERVNVLNEIRGQISKVIKDGGSLAQFKKSLPQIFDNYGITPLKNHHIENVFRTNTQTVYNLGRYESSITDKSVVGLQYVAVLDTRTRPEHAQWDGYRAPKNAVIWDSIYPPNGYMCRCTVLSLTEFYMKDQNIRFSRLSKKQGTKRVEALKNQSPEFKKFNKSLSQYSKTLKKLKAEKEKIA